MSNPETTNPEAEHNNPQGEKTKRYHAFLPNGFEVFGDTPEELQEEMRRYREK